MFCIIYSGSFEFFEKSRREINIVIMNVVKHNFLLHIYKNGRV